MGFLFLNGGGGGEDGGWKEECFSVISLSSSLGSVESPRFDGFSVVLLLPSSSESGSGPFAPSKSSEYVTLAGLGRGGPLLCWLLNVPFPIRAKLRLDCRISVVANPPSSGSNGSNTVDID